MDLLPAFLHLYSDRNIRPGSVCCSILVNSFEFGSYFNNHCKSTVKEIKNTDQESDLFSDGCESCVTLTTNDTKPDEILGSVVCRHSSTHLFVVCPQECEML